MKKLKYLFIFFAAFIPNLSFGQDAEEASLLEQY